GGDGGGVGDGAWRWSATITWVKRSLGTPFREPSAALLPSLAFFLEAGTVAADVEDGGAVEQPIQGGGGKHGGVGEDLAPVAEGLIARQGDALPLPAARSAATTTTPPPIPSTCWTPPS